jgi:hypothetical protein
MVTTAFILGSPRSGTTIMEDTLERHPKIDTWYEPLFVTDYHFRDAIHDERDEADARPEVKAQIRRAFDYYRKQRRSQLVVDKNPFNSFRLPFLYAIFPEAKFIHMLRDGRDATLSIRVEWEKRNKLLTQNNAFDRVQALRRYLDRQPLMMHKIAALWFEIGHPLNLLKGANATSYREWRWRGHKGWGLRFKGWEEVIDKVSVVEFSAMVWTKSVEAVEVNRHCIPAEQFLEVRYENFLKDPEGALNGIFHFLELETPSDFLAHIPTLKTDNYGKWRDSFTTEEKAQIGPILNPLLMSLGYSDSRAWYQPEASP